MLVHVPGVHMVQMAIVKIIDVVAVLHSRMAATRPMLMRVVLVVGKFAVAHGALPLILIAAQIR